MERSWEDLHLMAESEDERIRSYAVIKARAKAGEHIDGKIWPNYVLKTAEIRNYIAHKTQYDPTIEDARKIVRVFFEAWQNMSPTKDISSTVAHSQHVAGSGNNENKDENPTVPMPNIGRMQTETIIVNLPAKDKWHRIAQLAESEKVQERKESIFHAWSELTAGAVNFHTLYPDQVGDPNDDIGRAINDICEILGVPGLFAIGEGEDERSRAMVILSRVIRGYQKVNFPTAKDTKYIVNTLHNLCTVAREFLRKCRNENINILQEKEGETEEPGQLSVLELAEELGVGSEEVMSRCVYLEIPITSLVSNLSDEDIFKLREEFKCLNQRGKMIQTRNGAVIHRRTAVVVKGK